MRLAAAVLLVAAAAPAAAGEWERFVHEDGVAGYFRAVPGSRVLEIRSVVVVDARIEVVGAVLRDVPGLKRPGSSCTDARFVRMTDRDHYTFYVSYAVPFPFQDRDAVVRVHNRYDLDHGRVIAGLRAVPDPAVPVDPDKVRIGEFEAQFVIEYLGRERTGVVYTSRVDPGGNVPAFVANHVARASVLDNARALRRAVTHAEYAERAAASADAALAESLLADPAAVRRVVANRIGELTDDGALAARLAADPAIVDAFVHGDGEVGRTLLLGWGSAESRREALALLLRRAGSPAAAPGEPPRVGLP
jgi:hypothetical protein